MKFNSQICTSREQSERLLALGLKPETADMYLQSVLNDEWSPFVPIAFPYSDRPEEIIAPDVVNVIPAWSLNRLIEMMPLDVVPEGGFDNIFTLTKGYPSGYSVEYDGFSYYHEKNIYDTLIEGIEHLIKEGYFNKEYLVWKRKAKFRK